MISEHNGVGLFARRRLPPFIKVVDRHRAAAASLKRLAERQPGIDPLNFGIDVGETDLDVLGPERHQTSMHNVEGALAGLAVVADNQQRIGRRHISAQRYVGHGSLGWDGEDEFNLAEIGGGTNTALDLTDDAARALPSTCGAPSMMTRSRSRRCGLRRLL